MLNIAKQLLKKKPSNYRATSFCNDAIFLAYPIIYWRCYTAYRGWITPVADEF